MPKPVCVPCKRFFSPYKTGRRWLEQMPTVNGAPPGTAEEHLWVPYKIWVSDEWRCDGCGASIIVGHGCAPLSEHYMVGFKDLLELTHAEDFKVNDC